MEQTDHQGDERGPWRGLLFLVIIVTSWFSTNLGFLVCPEAKLCIDPSELPVFRDPSVPGASDSLSLGSGPLTSDAPHLSMSPLQPHDAFTMSPLLLGERSSWPPLFTFFSFSS